MSVQLKPGQLISVQRTPSIHHLAHCALNAPHHVSAHALHPRHFVDGPNPYSVPGGTFAAARLPSPPAPNSEGEAVASLVASLYFLVMWPVIPYLAAVISTRHSAASFSCASLPQPDPIIAKDVDRMRRCCNNRYYP